MNYCSVKGKPRRYGRNIYIRYGRNSIDVRDNRNIFVRDGRDFYGGNGGNIYVRNSRNIYVGNGRNFYGRYGRNIYVRNGRNIYVRNIGKISYVRNFWNIHSGNGWNIGVMRDRHLYIDIIHVRHCGTVQYIFIKWRNSVHPILSNSFRLQRNIDKPWNNADSKRFQKHHNKIRFLVNNMISAALLSVMQHSSNYIKGVLLMRR